MGSITSSASPVAAPLGLVNLNPATVPLVVKGASGQSANLQEWQDSNANAKAYMDPGGQLFIDSSTSTTSAPATFGMINLSTNNAARWQFGSSAVGIQEANASDMQIYNYWGLQLIGGRQTGGAPSFSQTTAVGVSVINTVASNIGLIVKAAPSQADDLQQWQDSAAHVQFGVANAGTGAAPQWALRARAVANAESAAQTHTLGAYSGRSIQLLDDAGSTIGWLPIYA